MNADGAPQIPLRRLLIWIGIVLAVVYLIFIGGTWSGIYFAVLRVPTVAIATTALAIWFVVAWRDPAWLPASGMFPAIGAGLGALVVSTVFSRAPRVSLEYVAYGVLLIAVYLLLVRLLRDSFFRKRLVALVAMLFVSLSVLYVVVNLAHWITWWSLVGHLTTPPLRPHYEGLMYGNPSTILALILLLGLSVIGAYGDGSTRGRAVVVVVSVTIAIVAFLSGSRAGWLAIALTVAILVGGWTAFGRGRAELLRVVRSVGSTARGRASLAVAVVALALVAIAFTPAVLQRALFGGEDLRATYAVVSARLFLASPIVGTGPGSWAIERIAATDATEPDYYVPHAHNIEMQTLAELGIVGFVAGGFVVLQLARLLRNGLRDQDPGRRRWALAATFGILYFGLHQLLDYHREPGVLFAAAFPFAFLDATAAPGQMGWQVRAVSRRLFGLGAGVVLLASAALLVQEIPALQLQTAVDAANRFDWAAADAPARAAATEDPAISPYVFTAGLTASRAGDHAAAAEFFRTVAQRDDYPEAWVNLAAEESLLGRDTEARTSIENALRLGKQRSSVAMAAGDLALRLGATDLAVEAFANAIAVGPTLAGDEWWTADPARAEAFAAALPESIALAGPDIAWRIALMAGHEDEALSLSKDADNPRSARQIIAAWNNQAKDSDLFKTCSDTPLDLELVISCALVANRHGDPTAAAAYRVMAHALSSAGERRAFPLRVWEGEPDARLAEGRTAAIWGTFAYRRELPHDVFVEELVHLTSLD